MHVLPQAQGAKPLCKLPGPCHSRSLLEPGPAGFSKSQRLTLCSSALATTCCPLTKWDRR